MSPEAWDTVTHGGGYPEGDGVEAFSRRKADLGIQTGPHP